MAAIGFVGAGNMAEALIKGIITAKLYAPEDVFISDISPYSYPVLGKCLTNPPQSFLIDDSYGVI